MANQYETARDIYTAWGVDTEEALRKMDTIPVSINCWQLDDLTGFEDFDAALTGGIAATGNAPGKPRSVEEYFVSLDKMLSLVPGAQHLALHAVYPLTNGVKVPRNEIRPEHFAGWVDYAREKGIGLDFNPTYFSHPMLRDNWTLASPEKEVRDFWVQHGIACRKIGEYFGRELGEVCITNHWIPDGSKDTRVDTLGPRERLVESLDRIFAEPIDRKYNRDSIEGKVFGLGLESYTAGSHEFYTNYALDRQGHGLHGYRPLPSDRERCGEALVLLRVRPGDHDASLPRRALGQRPCRHRVGGYRRHHAGDQALQCV